MEMAFDPIYKHGNRGGFQEQGTGAIQGPGHSELKP
jgi:hypothetical protein